MTGTTYYYDKQLKQFFFICPAYCPSNTIHVISNEPDIPHYVSNTIGIPYPPVPSLAQAADIPPSLKRSSVNSSDVQTAQPTWPDQNYTLDARWDNPTFTTFNLGNVENTTAQPHLELSKLTESRSRSPQLNVPIKHHNGNDKSNPHGMNNLLLKLDEQHPRFQELVSINDHLMQNSNPVTDRKFDKTPQQLTWTKECKTNGPKLTQRTM